jgi:hypothetical protein
MKIYQFKITLNHIKPPVWRRFQVQENTDLESLHYIIQIVMGWEDSHLYQFIIDKQYYTTPFADGDDFNDSKPAADTILKQVIHQLKQKMTYEYDFGDGWEHVLELEEILEKDPKIKYPICITGKRACPPEDCGGPWGYAELVEIIKNPKHPEYEDMMEWLGGEFDPEHFSVEEVNTGLQQ